MASFPVIDNEASMLEQVWGCDDYGGADTGLTRRFAER
jgi:hypothetical protein